MKILTVQDISITLIRKPIRSINLHVSPSGVWVSAPMRMAQAEIIRFLQSHLDWIRQRQLHYAQVPPTKQLCTGERIPIWGKQFTLEVRSGMPDLTLTQDKLILTLPAQATLADRAAMLSTWYRQLLMQKIIEIKPHFEQLVGQAAAEYRIRKMKTRWGTCNMRARRIWINLQLAEKPPEWLDYIIVHELTHLLVPNHSAAFWAHMDQFYPNWRDIRQQMRHSTL